MKLCFPIYFALFPLAIVVFCKLFRKGSRMLFRILAKISFCERLYNSEEHVHGEVCIMQRYKLEDILFYEIRLYERQKNKQTVPFRKISTPGNQVKLRYFSQCVLSVD